jgi:hypothetical protein
MALGPLKFQKRQHELFGSYLGICLPSGVFETGTLQTRPRLSRIGNNRGARGVDRWPMRSRTPIEIAVTWRVSLAKLMIYRANPKADYGSLLRVMDPTEPPSEWLDAKITPIFGDEIIIT